MLELA
jgi:hypothetical protein